MERADPLTLRTLADATMQRTAEEMQGILQALAARLDPFPNFAGMTTLQAVEVDPEGFIPKERGCVVLCQDAEFYELALKLVPPVGEFADGMDQVDELKQLEMPPHEYIPYAYAAIRELARLLHGRSPRA
ncbi:MAG: hypothetical protein HYY00_06795 [Chloroflexi bacterium]|nr:hypothetical protein [Chloroflexota bacterium]